MVDLEAEARERLADEIAKVVEDARSSRLTLRTGPHAARLFAAHPNANRSVGHIVDQLIAAAVAAGVAVEITHNRSS
jgi:hypothetical protein